jgi:hypothetical protein
MPWSIHCDCNGCGVQILAWKHQESLLSMKLKSRKVSDMKSIIQTAVECCGQFPRMLPFISFYYKAMWGEDVSALLKALEALAAPGCVVLLVAKVRSTLDAKHAKDMQKTWKRHAKDMQKTCNTSTYFNPSFVHSCSLFSMGSFPRSSPAIEAFGDALLRIS